MKSTLNLTKEKTSQEAQSGKKKGHKARGQRGRTERERERGREKKRERALTVARGRIRHVGSSKFAD